ncbi:type VI secretion system baseplate subunit TssK [soil metagenome]
MSWNSRVVWSRGMFLQPHHFQQEARFNDRQVDARSRAIHPFAWGFETLSLDEGALALGRIAILRASGVLPDGTAFSIPDLDPAPPPYDVPGDVRDEIVLLAVPVARAGAVEYDFGTGSDAQLARYRVDEETLHDQTNAGEQSVSIQTGRLNLRLLRTRELSDAYAAIGVARVIERRADQQITLDREYIAPQTRLSATGQFAPVTTLLRGLLSQRADALAGRMGQMAQGVSELADFLMLQTVNRYEPLLIQHVQLDNAHPQQLHRDCISLAGDLASLLSAKRRPPDFPVYRHEDLAGTYRPVIAELRRMLSTELAQNALAIELVDRNHGVRTAVVADMELVRTATFVMAVNAQMPPDQLRQRFLAQTKVGPTDRLRDLVNLQLPGITLRNLPVAPRQLPYHAGFFYFELERSGDLWSQFQRSGNLGMHVAGEFPGLTLELWAIRAA